MCIHFDHGGFADSTNRIAAADAGVDDFLSKPLNIEELWMRLRVAERILRYATQVQQLEELLPICSYCKKIRDDQNYWQQMEGYINERTGSEFSHSVCPDCMTSVVQPEMDEMRAERSRSMSAGSMGEETAERVLRLEEKVAYLERHVTAQDEVMLELGDTLARVRAELKLMRERAGESESRRRCRARRGRGTEGRTAAALLTLGAAENFGCENQNDRKSLRRAGRRETDSTPL